MKKMLLVALALSLVACSSAPRNFSGMKCQGTVGQLLVPMSFTPGAGAFVDYFLGNTEESKVIFQAVPMGDSIYMSALDMADKKPHVVFIRTVKIMGEETSMMEFYKNQKYEITCK